MNIHKTIYLLDIEVHVKHFNIHPKLKELEIIRERCHLKYNLYKLAQMCRNLGQTLVVADNTSFILQGKNIL